MGRNGKSTTLSGYVRTAWELLSEPKRSVHTRMERRLTSGARPVGKPTAFRLCGWGGRKQEGKGRERRTNPGGAGAEKPFTPPHHFGLFNKCKASFVEVKSKEAGCRWGNLVFGVTDRKIEQQ